MATLLLFSITTRGILDDDERDVEDVLDVRLVIWEAFQYRRERVRYQEQDDELDCGHGSTDANIKRGVCTNIHRWMLRAARRHTRTLCPMSAVQLCYYAKSGVRVLI